ncbi:hypothetical protein C8F01DRAFT_1371722 [Mycena amicta]|nr:hypothetical protein C8F01DRAFT_1371722 [Mycena amicta]
MAQLEIDIDSETSNKDIRFALEPPDSNAPDSDDGENSARRPGFPSASPYSENTMALLEPHARLENRQTNDAYNRLNAFFKANSSAIRSAGTGLSSDDDVKALDKRITTFTETAKLILDGLDVLGQLHPAVGVAVQAFKLVITLDIARRDNNKKVAAIKLQMQSMMVLLFELRYIADPQAQDPSSGTTLKERISVLMDGIAKHITECGSACDLYLKKGFIVKTIKSKVYEARLNDFAQLFEDHKVEIKLALQVYVTQGVDFANQQLARVDMRLQAITVTMENIFRKLDTKRERDVLKVIQDKGGVAACLDSDTTLLELFTLGGESASVYDANYLPGNDLTRARSVLSREIAEDIDEAFKKNLEVFDGKLEMHNSRLTANIRLSEQHIITAISDGVFKNISDRELREIWRDHSWKRSIKARTFVLALNDYYAEKYHRTHLEIDGSEVSSGDADRPGSPTFSVMRLDAKPQEADDDSWALAYINVAHLQPILEAVDDDGSGVVTIQEANNFAHGKPKGWSLLRWVAYWAAGWHPTVTWYKNRIYKLLGSMNTIVQHALPANIQAVDIYFRGIGIRRVEHLLRSTRSASSNVLQDLKLKEISEQFRIKEETKLKARLQKLLYDLDTASTIQLITGMRRIDRYIYPLLYLLLKRHFDILRIACKHVLDEREFDQMSNSLLTIFGVVDARITNIEAVFRSTSTDTKERFRFLSFGMFKSLHELTEHDPRNNTIGTFQEDDGFGLEEGETEDMALNLANAKELQLPDLREDDLKILRYGTQNEPKEMYDFHIRYPFRIVDSSQSLEGVWTGRMTEETGSWGNSTVVFSVAHGKITGGIETLIGVFPLTATLEGDSLSIAISWLGGSDVDFVGTYDREHQQITGTWSFRSAAADPTKKFEFSPKRKRRPNTLATTDGLSSQEIARARWVFAISATIDEIKSRTFSWPSLKQRLETQRRSIELLRRCRGTQLKISTVTPLNPDEFAELVNLLNELPSEDCRFFNYIANSQLRQQVYYARDCDSCSRHIRDIWHLCLLCIKENFDNGIDRCTDCIHKSVQAQGFTHDSAHVLVKSYRYIHDRDFAWMLPQAKVVANRVKKGFREAIQPAATEGAVPTSDPLAVQSKPQSPACVRCGEVIALPCLVCVVCVPDTFICLACDAQRSNAIHEAKHGAVHKLLHPLVSGSKKWPAKISSVESKLQTQMASLEQKLAARMAVLEEKMDTKLKNIEDLLQGIGEKLRVENGT